MNQYRDAVISSEQMIIIKKFDVTVNYLYPILNNAPRMHGSLRDAIFNALFEQVNLFIKAGKSGQKSKLYMCDAGLANIRYLLKTGEVWILKTDFSGYFYNIDRSVLHKRIRAKISCKETLKLIEKFIPNNGTGIPIGNLTSQLFANVHGTIADEWLLHTAKNKKIH